MAGRYLTTDDDARFLTVTYAAAAYNLHSFTRGRFQSTEKFLLLFKDNGEKELTNKTHPYIKQGLSRESVEWRRSFGRPARKIKVKCKFVPFSVDSLAGDDTWSLLGKQFFHVYFTDCDIDGYKTNVKDDIASWLTALRSKNISDWLIVVVMNDESKVKSKILRTSIIDKVKNDFCAKHLDRCIVLQEPFRPDSKSSDSWNKLFSLLRQLILQSYNTALNRFEEHMREERERRQEPGWSFNKYFLLQEELAFLFEMLGLYEDALVQYDELDALFTQFVLNHAVGDTANWLSSYIEQPPDRWQGIMLSHPIDVEKRAKINDNSASLVDFRNYLFLRQSTLLFLLLRPWQVAERAIPFMHNCLQELAMLQIKLEPGSTACWVLLTCLEIVQTCETFASSGQMDPYSLHMAMLWDYSRKKLLLLGELAQIICTNSEFLPECVDNFLLGSSPGVCTTDTGPMVKLREAMSSNKAFKKHYLELSELAMGAYKHIGRMRSAKLISKDLADFYMRCGEPQKAESFLQDALKLYVAESWQCLADDTRLALASCQLQMQATDKYIRTCVHLVASPVLEAEQRKHFLTEVITKATERTDSALCLPCRPLFTLTEATPLNNTAAFEVYKECLLRLTIHLSSADKVQCENISVAVACRADSGGHHADPISALKQHRRTASSTSFCSVTSGSSLDHLPSPGTPLGGTGAALGEARQHPLHRTSPGYPALPMTQHNDYTPNRKRLAAVALRSRVSLRRLESGGSGGSGGASSKTLVLDRDIERGDYSAAMTAVGAPCTLYPGRNEICVRATFDEAGQYLVTQVDIQMKGIHFLRNIPVEEVMFDVVKNDSKLNLTFGEGLPCLGIPHDAEMSVEIGSSQVTRPLQVKLASPTGLQITGQMVKNSTIEIPTDSCRKGTIKFPLSLLAPVVEDRTVTHNINISCDDLKIHFEKQVVFAQPLTITHKLLTCHQRKLVQILVESEVDLQCEVRSPILNSTCKDVELISFNKANATLVINKAQNISYIWEFKTNVADADLCVDFDFNVQYRHLGLTVQEGWSPSKFTFTLENYKTLFKVKTELEITEGAKVFQTGEQYCFLLRCRRVETNAIKNVLYNLTWDDKVFEINGSTVGLVRCDEEGLFSARLRVTPLQPGTHTLPQLQLVTYNTELVSESQLDDLIEHDENFVSPPFALHHLQEALLRLCPAPQGSSGSESDSIDSTGSEHTSREDAERSSEVTAGSAQVRLLSTFATGQVYNASQACSVVVHEPVKRIAKPIQHPLQQIEAGFN